MKTILIKRLLLILAVFFLAPIFLCPQQVSNSQSWTFASSVFTLESAEKQDPVLEAATKLIPQLILEECALCEHRVISPAEEASRALYKLKIERNTFYAELSQHIQTRDIIVFSAKERSSSAIQKKIKDQEKIIADTEQKIALNTEKAQKIKEQAADSSDSIVPVSLWKNDPAVPYEKKHKLANPYADGISGLITGSVSRRGDYISVTAVLTVYPEGLEQVRVSEVGGINDARRIAKNIAKQLFSVIINEAPAVLSVTIEPAEAALKAAVYINGVQYAHAETFEVVSGPCTLYVTSAGYESAHMRFTFESAGAYTVTAALKPATAQEILFTTEAQGGAIFLQGIPKGVVPTEVKVSGKNILGEFLSETGQSTFFEFTLPDSRKNPVAVLSANIIPNATDIAAGIEKTRKSLYTSYGALLLSLPFSYLSYGSYVNAYNSWARGFGSESERDYWKTTSNITMGISIGCGVLFAVQLGRYLFMANKVIPKQIAIDGIKIKY